MSKHRCSFFVSWKPKGKSEYVSWEFEEDNEDAADRRVAQVAWLLNHPKSFAEDGAAPNVTEADANAAQDIITYVLNALQWGTPADLDELHSMVERLNEGFKGDAKRRRFVDEVKDLAIEIQATPAERQDELLKSLLSNLGFWCEAWAFKELDPAMVKGAIASIDPHNDKGGRGKKGPPWLAARLIVASNAGDEFDLPRPTEADEGYFDYVLQSLQNACRPGRGKPKSSAKRTKKA